MFNIFKDTIGRDLTKIANYFNGRVDSGEVFKDRKALAINRIKNAVLDGEIGGGGITPEIEAEIENAQWKTKSTEQLFSETVTTVEPAEGVGFGLATLEYSELIDADTLIVTFNGTEYTCTKRTIETADDVEYGAQYILETDSYDFSEYPFLIVSQPGSNTNDIFTENPGTYTVSANGETVTTTETFDDEVYSLIDSYLSDLGGVLHETTDPDEALFCTVKINGFAGVNNVRINIDETGAVSFTTTNAMPTGFIGSLVLARYIDPLSGELLFTNGNTYLEPPGGLSSGRLNLTGLFSATAQSNVVSLHCSISTNAAYSDLEVHYFTVTATSEDGGEDSPIEPEPIG